MVKILVDAYGGDNAPHEILKGCAEALEAAQNFNLVLFGKAEVISETLKEAGSDFSRIEIVDARDVITNDQSPTEAIRKQTDSSLVKALLRLKEDGEADAFISAGSTGAVLAGGLLKVGRLPGILRPALAPLLPTYPGAHVLLIDCGANVDSRPEYLLQFGAMGSAYMKAVMGIKEPRVALLSNGAEDKKGNELTKAAFLLLKESKLNFTGNMEARDMLSGDCDVIVCDGFAGNVALKSVEGAAHTIFKLLKEEISTGFKSKLGALLMKKKLKSLAGRLDYTRLGGAIFLGTSKLIIKNHGSSKAVTVCASILQAKEMVEKKLLESVKSELAMLPASAAE